MICIWHCFECEMGLSQHKSQKSFTSLEVSERSETSAEITHLARETMPYMHFLAQFPMFCALLNVFIISFFTRVRDGYISDLVSKWGVCFEVRELMFIITVDTLTGFSSCKRPFNI